MRVAKLILNALLVVGLPALAQKFPEAHGRPAPPPSRGPAPYHGTPKASPVQKSPGMNQPSQQRNYSDRPGHPDLPHVDQGNRWVGHDTGRDDANYRVDRPFEHGRFTGGFGPAYPIDSGSTVGTGTLHQSILVSAAIGIGTAMTSLSTMIPTTLAGTLPTMYVWELMST